MSAYTATVALHVAIAVLGTGQTAAMAIVARAGRADGSERTMLPVLRTLANALTGSLVLLLLTGIVATYLGSAVFAGMWWFRISVALFVVLGALSGQARRALRRGAEASLSRIERLAWTMCFVVVVIVVLMEAKPF